MLRVSIPTYSRPYVLMEWCLISTGTKYPFFYLYVSICLQMLLHYICPHLRLSCGDHNKEVPLCFICFFVVFWFQKDKNIHSCGWIFAVHFSSLMFILWAPWGGFFFFGTNLDQEFQTCGMPFHLIQPSHWYSYVVCHGPECLTFRHQASSV